MPDIDLTAALEAAREAVRRTADAILAAATAALNPSRAASDISAKIARLAAPAVLRAYADAEHHLGDARSATCLPGGWLEPDAWCVCGASWGEEGCTERGRLLAVAVQVEGGPDG
jgi:hypothetical protein